MPAADVSSFGPSMAPISANAILYHGVNATSPALDGGPTVVNGASVGSFDFSGGSAGISLMPGNGGLSIQRSVHAGVLISPRSPRASP